MKRGLILFGAFVMMVSVVSAIEVNLEGIDLSEINCFYLENYKSEIINQKIPDQIPLQDEILNLYLNESFFMGITIENRTITDLNCSPYEENTYDLNVKDVQALLLELQVEEADIFEVILNNLNNGNIEIEGKNFGKQLNWFFINLGLKIFSWFS